MAMMPENDSVRIKHDAKVATLSKEFEDMQQDYQKKVEAYQKNQNEYSQAMRNQKEREIMETQRTIEEFQQVASQEIQQYRSQLLAPIYNRILESIKKVSKAQGVTFVMDKGNPPFVYYDEATVVDLSAAVKKDLGL